MNGKQIALSVIKTNDMLYTRELWIGDNQIVAWSEILNSRKVVYAGDIPQAEISECAKSLAEAMAVFLPFDVYIYGGEYQEYRDRIYHNYRADTAHILNYNKDLQTKTMMQIERDLNTLKQNITSLKDDSANKEVTKDIYKRLLNYGKKLEGVFGLHWL